MSDSKIYLEVDRFQSGEERRKKNEEKNEEIKRSWGWGGVLETDCRNKKD